MPQQKRKGQRSHMERCACHTQGRAQTHDAWDRASRGDGPSAHGQGEMQCLLQQPTQQGDCVWEQLPQLCCAAETRGWQQQQPVPCIDTPCAPMTLAARQGWLWSTLKHKGDMQAHYEWLPGCSCTQLHAAPRQAALTALLPDDLTTPRLASLLCLTPAVNWLATGRCSGPPAGV